MKKFMTIKIVEQGFSEEEKVRLANSISQVVGALMMYARGSNEKQAYTLNCSRDWVKEELKLKG